MLSCVQQRSRRLQLRSCRFSSLPPRPLCLRRQLSAAGRTLSKFAAAVEHEVAAAGASAPLVRQIIAGNSAAASCSMLACTLKQLEPETALAISAACSLAFGTGRPLLAPIVWSRLAEVTLQLWASQLEAAVAALDMLLPSQHARAAVAFASSTAKPAVLMLWLRELCQVLLRCDGIATAGEAWAALQAGRARWHVSLGQLPRAHRLHACRSGP